MKKFILLLVLILSYSFAFSEDQVQIKSTKIPFNGLTRTITDLFKAKPKTRIQLGSYYLNPEDFVEQNINEIFDCDKVGNAYLSGSDDVYYEQFANIITEEITNNILDKSAHGNVLVNASADNNIITISIAVNYTKNAILPIYFDTVNSELKLSASIDCVVDYQITFDIELDAKKVNNDDLLSGTNITLYAYSFDIKPIEGDLKQTTAKVIYKNEFYDVAFSAEYINYNINWRLLRNDDYGEDPQKITYEQLKNGDYQWEIGLLSNVSFSVTSINDDINETDKLEMSIEINDTTSKEYQNFNVTDDEGSKELLVKQLIF